MARKKFTSYDLGTVENIEAMPLSDLVELLTVLGKKCPDAVVTLRQSYGTDFPPFIAIESREEYEKRNEEGWCPSCYC